MTIDAGFCHLAGSSCNIARNAGFKITHQSRTAKERTFIELRGRKLDAGSSRLRVAEGEGLYPNVLSQLCAGPRAASLDEVSRRQKRSRRESMMRR